MTIQKDFKRLVRGRMQKTGESYTAARAQLLTTQADGASPVNRLAVPSRGLREARRQEPTRSIKARTGCTWERWVKALDHVKAHTWSHREIAKYVHEKYKVSGWWAQSVTVGYERIKGLRAVGQRRDGSFEASKSRTFSVPVSTLYGAFHDARIRSRWLPGVDLTVRTATRDKSMRISWPDGTSLEIGFTGQGAREESSRAGPREAVRQGRRDPREGVLGRAVRRTRGRSGLARRFPCLATLPGRPDGRRAAPRTLRMTQPTAP